MPWKEVTKVSSRLEFIQLALKKEHTFSNLCKRFGISRKTGYKILHRYELHGESGLEDYSRRPKNSPKRTEKALEEKIVQVRRSKPYWGARKIRAWLENQGETGLPATSTITSILHRYGLIQEEDSKKRKALTRFEHANPNDLWQIDFKGHFSTRAGRCYPLTILDDHSRFSIGLRACRDEKGKTIEPHFKEIFENYGMPWQINFDNGSPWGSNGQNRLTRFSIWLMRLGIRVSFSRPRHPQTNGKDERFHRTLKTELLRYRIFLDLQEAQNSFDTWRMEYNFERPHEALGMQPPISRYRLSTRTYPKQLDDIEYQSVDKVCKVNSRGNINFKGHKYFIGQGLAGLPVGLKKYSEDSFHVYFCHQKVRHIVVGKRIGVTH